MNWLEKYDRNIQSPFHDRTRRNFRLLLESEHWSRDDMLDYQFKRLQQTYSYARKSVPFYKESYHQFPAHLESWEQFFALPTLNRGDAAERNTELFGDPPPFGATATNVSTTSGSSGARVQVQGTDVGESMRVATALREFQWMELDPHVPSLFIRALSKPGDPNYEKLRTGIKLTSEPRDALMSMYTTKDKFLIDTSAPSEHLAKFVDAAAPQYILCFPSALRAAIPFLSATHSVRWIKTIGESLDPETKSYFEKTLGATVWDAYSCQEVNSIAFTGRGISNMRIHEENVFMEVVDKNGMPAESGRVLLTSLHPAVTPFIRYDIGDTSTLSKTNTGSLREIASLDGRIFAQVRTPDGQLQSDSPLFVSLHALPGYVAIQVLQHSVESFELLIQGNSVDLDAVRRIVENQYPWAKEVKLTVVDQIQRTAGGKLPRYRWLGS